jgi:hypothetical protein
MLLRTLFLLALTASAMAESRPPNIVLLMANNHAL